jgi:hypothetical protein
MEEVAKVTQRDEARLSGENLGNLLANTVREVGLELSCLIGQGYDTAKRMSSHAVGVAAVITRELAPEGQYYHCAMHVFNLVAATLTRIHVSETAWISMRIFQQQSKAKFSSQTDG